MAKRNERDFTNSKAWKDWLSDDYIPPEPVKKTDKPSFSVSLDRQPAQKISQTPIAGVANHPRRTEGVPRATIPQASPRPAHVVADRSARLNGAQTSRNPLHSSARPVAGSVVKPKASEDSKTGKGQDTQQPLIAVNLTLPNFSLPRLRLPAWRPTRGQKRGAIGALLVIGLLVGGWMLSGKLAKKPEQTTAVPKTTIAVATDLGFVPLAPAGRGNLVPGKSNPYYNSAKKFYQYNENYKGAAITLNEQPFPEKLSKKAEMDKLRKSINAKDSFTTTFGTVYIATDENSGAQRLILTNKYLLMFLQSTKTLSNDQWVEYIESFERIK